MDAKTRAARAEEMIYITRKEYQELTEIKEIYDRATAKEHGTERTSDNGTGTVDSDQTLLTE